MDNPYKENQTEVFLSIGGNLGDRISNLTEALRILYEEFPTGFVVSPVYETPAWGFESDQNFLNCCVRFLTEITADELLKTCQYVESALGRSRNNQFGYSSRTMDVDILYFGDRIIAETRLIVPHPKLYDRNFVLYPLCDIAPLFLDPSKNLTIKQLKSACKDKSVISLYTNKLLTFM